MTDAEGNSVSYTYDVRGRTTTAKDKLGSVTKYTYDANGNVTSTKDAAGRSTRYNYDALGNLTKTTNRMNESVSYTYDAMSRRIKEKNELNQTREYEYDEAGNLVSVTDGNRHVTTYTYDKLSRLVREENAEGGIAEYTYDYLGNISTYTVYGGGNERAVTTYTYDAAGNLTKETSPLGYTTTYAYDANGNVTSRTDENGTETTYEYDALGRLIKREDRDGQVSYTYDKVGNVTSATNDAGTVSFTYDELYRTVKVTNEDGSETSYTYDAAGNRLGITYPDGKAVTTVYDELGRVLSLTDHDGTGILYTRDAEGRVTKETYSDGSTTEYTYNAAGLLTLQKEVTKDNETLRQIVYAYDDAGNLTSENRSGVGIERKDELVRYYYDKADQLVKTNVEGEVKSYTYDKAGNLLSDGESAYTYDIQNRLLTKTNADGTTTYSYDKAGNLTREIAPDGITNYTYSAQNKLVKGEKTNGESSTYVYNALGVRIANTQVRTNRNAGNQNAGLKDGSHGVDYLRFLKDGRSTWQRAWETEIGTTVQNDKETVTRHYTVDYLSIANRDIFVTEDGSYTTRYVYDASGRRISAEFDYAPGTKRGEAGENLQSDIAVSIGKVFYRTSILGSTLFAVDKDGNQIAHAVYDPWGKPLTETYTDSNYSGLENLNNYTGYTWDVTLALYYAQNRFYDSDTHRFTQEDIVKDGANWYVYCSNNPTVYFDWVGLKYKYIVLDKYLVEPTDKTYTSFGYVSLKEIISILKKYNVLSSSYKYNDSTTILAINSSKQKPIEYREIRIKLQGGAGLGEAISNYATSYFYIICCSDSKQDNIYVDLFSFTSAINLSSRVQWCVTSLEDKITENDIKKGVRVKIFNGKQYLDVTKPVENAVKADTFRFCSHQMDFLWFYHQVASGCKWDIKLPDVWSETIGTTFPGRYDTQVYFQNSIVTPEVLGNITYGYLGCCASLGAFLLAGGDFAAAGGSINNINDLLNGLMGIITSKDSPDDKEAIRKGMDWYYKERNYDW